MRGGDKTIMVPLLEEKKGDTEVDPGVDTRTVGEVHLETEENGLETSKERTLIDKTREGLA